MWCDPEKLGAGLWLVKGNPDPMGRAKLLPAPDLLGLSDHLLSQEVAHRWLCPILWGVDVSMGPLMDRGSSVSLKWWLKEDALKAWMGFSMQGSFSPCMEGCLPARDPTCLHGDLLPSLSFLCLPSCCLGSMRSLPSDPRQTLMVGEHWVDFLLGVPIALDESVTVRRVHPTHMLWGGGSASLAPCWDT